MQATRRNLVQLAGAAASGILGAKISGFAIPTAAMPYPPGQSGYLTERGTLFYNGQIPNESHVGQAPYRGGAALEMDWKGRILWEVNHPDHNHDGIRLRNGTSF